MATATGSVREHINGAPTHGAARLSGVLDRAAKLSDELLKSVETGERATVEAVGRFVITIEDALPREVTGTADVFKTITESGLEMTDRLIHTEYDLLRELVVSGANSLRRRDASKPVATKAH